MKGRGEVSEPEVCTAENKNILIKCLFLMIEENFKHKTLLV